MKSLCNYCIKARLSGGLSGHWCINSFFSLVQIQPLKDEDRIFTNLYGRHDWKLKGAMSRVMYIYRANLSLIHLSANLLVRLLASGRNHFLLRDNFHIWFCQGSCQITGDYNIIMS